VQDGIFVIDSVVHAFDMSKANEADPRFAGPVNDFLGNLLATAPAGYAIDAEAAKRDWPVEETASMLFKESYTDIGIFHHTPIYFYKDGLSGLQKSAEAVEMHPDRFIGSYVAVDPLADDPIGQLERGMEAVQGKMMGLKLYPVSYIEGKVVPWQMDDPKIAFPLYDKVRELGIGHVAIHKSLPLGPSPSGDAFHPRDVEGAAAEYPDLTFEIVHGGISFTEETAWLFGRYPNIYINLETLAIFAVLRPRVFAEIFAGLLSVGTEAAIDRLLWATGSMNYHARPQLEAMMNFQMPDDLLEEGIFWPVPQITEEHKRKILGENAARLHGLDIEQLKARIEGDEFSVSQADGLLPAYSTTALADKVLAEADSEEPAIMAPGA
jgi:predicted TIM-barrel fold metal-dependent hydrolase